MTDFYSQNRCVCSTRSHGPLLCAFCLSFHFNRRNSVGCNVISTYYGGLIIIPLKYATLCILSRCISPRKCYYRNE